MPDNNHRLQELLQESSQTFALAIPLLEEPCREQVSLAYLLLRVADTLEDASLWPPQKRLTALAELSVQVEQSGQTAARCLIQHWG
jgi:farnesyl-diphosphate farnesyltransferase